MLVYKKSSYVILGSCRNPNTPGDLPNADRLFFAGNNFLDGIGIGHSLGGKLWVGDIRLIEQGFFDPISAGQDMDLLTAYLQAVHLLLDILTHPPISYGG
jgi:hypothetical protein